MLYDDNMMVEFTTFDRCDRCGAQAYSVAIREDILGELLFCMHHRMENADALERDGWTVTDSYEAYSNLAANEQIVY